MTGKLNLDPALVAQARELARLAGQPVTDLARTHTTVSVERAVLRLAGLDGADGRVSHVVDLSAITVAEREFPVLPAAEVNLRVRSALGRKLVVVGACIGTDAHTVGIDAILNVKGHAGEKGLEYYREIRVINMGAQVAVDDLVTRAAAEHADAVLVSQVVTQRDAHLSNIREMSAAFGSAFGPQRPLLVVGGPRFDPGAAHDLGVDKVFGRGTTPGEVASYLVHALAAPSEGAA